LSQLLEVFRKKIISRGARGIIGLQRVFKNMDDDRSKSLCKGEFEKACKEFKLDFTQEDTGVVF